MIKKIKAAVRNILKEKYDKEYERELLHHTMDYHDWVTAKEVLTIKEEERQVQSRPESKVTSFFVLQNLEEFKNLLEKEKAEIIMLASSMEGIRPGARERVEDVFCQNEEILLLYTDEDETDGKRRKNPWFKPDFSPETLLSYFYFGNFIALRRSFLLSCFHTVQDKTQIGKTQIHKTDSGEVEMEERETADRLPYNKTGREILYQVILENIHRIKDNNVFHLKEICYSSQETLNYGKKENDSWKTEAEEKIKGLLDNGVSIVIPSKDHPELIRQCLLSLKNTIKEIKYEIIVIDNGSCPENKIKIEKVIREFDAGYYHKPSEFNFSAMCNMGACKAKYDLLLFLNDDCEAVKPGWLESLAALAGIPKAGAVGVKLYYPGSIMIQHCGIYNIHVGPVHKLQFKEDNKTYYDGRNTGIRNVLAVTGACLMIRKDVFVKAGGFDENLAVAFNDVDLCYRLYKAGYRNVVNNDIYLYHHESLSRGSDEGEEKMIRLMTEKQKLYKKHSDIWNKDPYYHPCFTDDILDTGFSFAYEAFPKKVPDMLSPIESKLDYGMIREDTCVVGMMEYAGEPEGWFLKEGIEDTGGTGRSYIMKNFFYLQGNVVVLGSDNACFGRKILLHHMETDKKFEVTPGLRYRPDSVHNLCDQENVGLSGFACFIDRRKLPEGKYRIEFLVRDKISGNRLLRRTNRFLNNKYNNF